MIKVKTVQPGCLGQELGLEQGFELLALDGRELTDFLDWEFLTAQDHFVLLARSPQGELIEFDVERPEGIPLGVEIEPPRVRRCANRCDFCFVDGNPTGLREALYIRDDDYRLSFRHGNFATLTNLKQKDMDRIMEYRLSPLYVSVHATDPVIRRRLLRNPLAPDVLSQLRTFATVGIQCHTQIVLQPGLNDGDVLQQSLDDLFALGPSILSVSVVPVGLTEFSKHGAVREPTAEECRNAVAAVEEYAQRARHERGFHWSYGSDDLYLGAAIQLPPAERYDEFDQVENGVGSVRFLQGKVGYLNVDLAGKRVGVVTGRAMRRAMPLVLSDLEAGTGGRFEPIVVENTLFGASVTSAGLLPGADLARALEGRNDLDLALLPAEAVNEDGVLLDDLTIEQLSGSVPVEVRFSYHFSDVLAIGR
jgi:putative radical SAM enzyme (TIGR03279 family)